MTKLKIKNFVLIDDLEVDFNDGMTCITGETGAGKSILLGGLSLVLGKRADLSSLHDVSRKCVVEAIFQISFYNLKHMSLMKMILIIKRRQSYVGRFYLKENQELLLMIPLSI